MTALSVTQATTAPLSLVVNPRGSAGAATTAREERLTRDNSLWILVSSVLGFFLILLFVLF